MGLRDIRLYVIFTVALCALQAIGISLGTSFGINFDWPTVVLANFCAAQAALWSFVRQNKRCMTNTEKLLFAGYATALTTALATALMMGASTFVMPPDASLLDRFTVFLGEQNLFEIAFGFGVAVAAIVMGLSFGGQTCLRLQSRFSNQDHSAGAAKRV